ncbi:MAG TPA: patatin-like phospholipase family protein [Phnomibacter sp.]|nr:patatin-like phospholipase family protein [Phnomibacter sp.]
MKHPIRTYLVGFRYSLPIQLLLLHFKRYQILLVIWYVLFATVNGSFMNRFGGHILFLYPEYLNEVNAFSTFIVGAGVGVFVMCWNITTFILHSRECKFLAATTQPFLKYCINNAIIPICFLVFYGIQGIRFTYTQELLPVSTIAALAGGFFSGFAFIIAASFLYFFGADKTIYKRLTPQVKQSLRLKKHPLQNFKKRNGKRMRIDWYFSASFRLRQPRNVNHYDDEFLEAIFSQHHLAALFSALLLFAMLITAGYFQDSAYLQLPAAGSILVFFAVLIAVAGGSAHFLKQWSVVLLILVLLALNFLYQRNLLDTRNKAYGLDYQTSQRPIYNRQSVLNANTAPLVTADSLQYIEMLNTWKTKQGEAKPVLILFSCSGGGSRAATMTLHVMKKLDEASGDKFMQHTFLITGASGGMIGAAWFRELYRRNQLGLLKNADSALYTHAISLDLLNPIFSSYVTRDLLAPAQFFSYQNHKYSKDRGYAFEQKLGRNTFGWMDKTMGDYAAEEANASIPHMLLSSVITRDGRKLYIANHPVRFLTRPAITSHQYRTTNPDAIDFMSFFAAQQSTHISFLSALRMNATFPYILPNVWLPSNPVVDVMDAGFRDNTGIETSLRFAYYFRDWLKANCSRVVLVQVRDNPEGGWESPYEMDNIMDILTKPALLTQTNLFRFQEYDQLRQLELVQQSMDTLFQRVVFEYIPTHIHHAASLSFHITGREKNDVIQSMGLPVNQYALRSMQQWLR